MEKDEFNKLLEGVNLDALDAPKIVVPTPEEDVAMRAEADVRTWLGECKEYVDQRQRGQGYTMGLVLTVDERTGNVMFNTWNMDTNDILAYCEHMKQWALRRGK